MERGLPRANNNGGSRQKSGDEGYDAEGDESDAPQTMRRSSSSSSSSSSAKAAAMQMQESSKDPATVTLTSASLSQDFNQSGRSNRTTMRTTGSTRGAIAV